MRINQRPKVGALVALFAILAFASVAGTGARAGDTESHRRPVATIPSPDAVGASTTFVSGVPGALLSTLIGMPETAMAWGGVARLDLASGTEIPVLIGGGPTAYIVEEGHVAVRSDGSARIARAAAGSLQAGQVVLRGDEVTLGVGDRVVINAGVSYGLRNDGTTNATLLVTSILPFSAQDTPAFVNDGLAPETSLTVAMFLPGPDRVEAPAWPTGVTVKPIAAQEIGTGAAVATADDVRASASPPARSPRMGVEP